MNHIGSTISLAAVDSYLPRPYVGNGAWGLSGRAAKVTSCQIRWRPLLRVGDDGRFDVEYLRQSPFAVVLGPSGVSVGGERRPGVSDLRRHDLGVGHVVADQHGRLSAGQVAEHERHVESVAGAEGAAHARCRPGQLVHVGASGVCLGEVERRHPEQPVGVDPVVQLIGAVAGRAVLGDTVRPGANRLSAVAA